MSSYTLTMTLPQKLYERLQDQAQAGEHSVDEVIAEALTRSLPPEVEADLPPALHRELEAMAHLSDAAAQLAGEQMAWYKLSSEERAPYRGEYVAIYQGQVVDHDSNQRAPYIRVHERYGRVPIPILNADWEQLPTYVIRHPHVKLY